MKQSMKTKIYENILKKYNYNDTIFLSDLYQDFYSSKPGTIREMIRRLYNDGKLMRVKAGAYQIPNPDRILKKPTIKMTDAIESLYLKDESNNQIGYKSGINFANALGLTTQTASVETIYSNQVSNKKREVTINNLKFIINAPRTLVTNDNYKLLQILDLLTNYKQYSEYDILEITNKILSYLKGVKLKEKTIDEIVSAYPLKTQVIFYKIGVNNEITY